MAKKLHNCKIFFKEQNKPTSTYHNVNNIAKFKMFAESKGFNFFHVYDKSTREYLGTVYDDKFYDYMQRVGIVYKTHIIYNL